MAAIFPDPTWFVGCGNMAGAMVEGWRAGGVDLSAAVAIRPSGTPVEGVRTVDALSEAGRPPKLVVLGFKPQQIGDIAPDLAPWVTSKTWVVSLLAGTGAEALRARFPNARAIVRAMPNLPVSVRRGVIALHSDSIGEEDRRDLSDLFAVLGFAVWTETEQALSAIGSVAAAGPAYVARFIGALADAGKERGLPEPLAATIALETALGTAWLAATTGEPMESVARRVASPKGTTEAGLAVLDADSALGGLVSRTVEAAATRGSELAAETSSA